MARKSKAAKETQATGEDRPKSRRMGALRRLWPFMQPYRAMLAGACAMLLCTTVLNLALPMAAGRVVDGFSEQAADLMDKYFGAALAIAAGLALATAGRYYLVTRLGERVIADVRRAVYDKVVAMSPTFYERIMTGEVLSRLNTDTTLILSVISSSVSMALRNFLLLIGGLGMMFYTSPKLSLYTLLLVPLVVLPILFLGRKVRRLSRLSQDKIADSSALASETLLAAQTVQAFTRETLASKRYGGLVEEAFDAAKSRIFARAQLAGIVIFFVFTGIVGVLWIGATDLREGVISPGQIVQFLIYAVLVAGATGALSEIWGELQRAAGATERLVEMLDAEDPVETPKNPVVPTVPARGRVHFDGVSFRYPMRPDAPALEKISLEVNPGETIALVGPSGAGKTTLFQLLLRFYDPQEGAVLVDGVDARAMKQQDLRKHMSLVSQDVAVFGDTVAENIRFGRPDASMDDVIAAAKAAAAHDFIEALPDGYESFVGERGVMLSGGQRQRIAIARAILRDAPLLLLDEATSALDAQSETAVQQAIENLAKGRTVIVVAHRLATVKKADRILVLEEGRLVAEGTHDALVADGGLYAELAKLQFTH